MRQLADAVKYWTKLNQYQNLPDLKTAVLEAQEEPELLSGLRSLCWKVFLQFQNLNLASWPASLATSRSAYNALRAHHLRVIEHPDEIESAVDPLSETVESPWTALRSDEAIRQEIFQDVERCMPENVYFRQPATQTMLLDILFVYCKLNPDVGYRQGMHELLAPILWAVERDAVDITDSSDRASRQRQSNGLLSSVLDSRYIEHDTFTLFGLIMGTAKTFYDPAIDHNRSKSKGNRTVTHESAMLVRCRRIFIDLLPQVDPGLAAHLEKLDISPQLFLMRWVRLLFGREFPFNDLLQVWDLLFAEDASIELVDYICIAMLLRIRWQLVEADVNEALTLLLRYPCPSESYGPRTFVNDAIYLKANDDEQGGIDLIKKYTGRVPPRFKRSPPRSSTPDSTAGPGTPGSYRARSPFGSPAPRAFESLISDAARGVLSRGEKWGFNQAVRDAVGEVRKNVQGIQSGRSSPRILPSERQALHRSSRSDVSNNIAANVLKKITALEDRNKHLAKMLETAVADLWKIEKDTSEKKEMGEESLEALSMAVARVQFVQVFLQDSTLPLPPEEQMETTTRSSKPEEEPTPGTHQTQQPAPEPLPGDAEPQVASPKTSTSSLAPLPMPILTSPSGTQTPPASLPTTSLSSEHASGTSVSSLTPQPGRPRLEQSSFSWMLGQAHEDRSGFVNPSPFSPGERRYNAAHGGTEKGFLFGEEDDVVGEPKVKEKGKGKDKRRTSNVPRRIEDIGLGDIGSGSGPET